MQINFDVQIDTKDMFKFLMNNTYRKFTGIVWLIFSAVVVFVTVITWGQVELLYSLLMIVLASLYTIINPLMLLYKANKQVKNNKSFDSVLKYSLTDDGITVAQGDEEVTAPWEEIWKCNKYGDQIVVYVSAIRAYLWPIRCIGENYDNVVDVLQDKLGDNCYVGKK